MAASADAYVATSMLYSCLTSFAGVMVGFLLAFILELSFPYMLVLMVLFAALFVFLSYQLLLLYPSMSASEKARKVDIALPYTASFMYALSRSGATITDIFRELSTRRDVGELAAEAKVFLRDVEYLGRDPLTALRNLSRSTPSERFKNFLEVMVSIIETGGDTTNYFATKCSEYQAQVREDQKKYISTLEFMAEFYVIMVVFAPLLFLTIFILMGMLETIAEALLYVIAYIWIPFGSIGFVVAISAASKGRLKRVPLGFRRPEAFRDVAVVRGDERDRAMLRRILKSASAIGLKAALKNPARAIRENPSYILLVSVPVAMVFFIVNPLGGWSWYSGAEPISSSVFAATIALLPYIVAFELRSRWVKQTEDALPDFLKSLESAIKSGLTLSRSVAVTATTELGPLSDEVRRMDRSIKWGTSSTEALGEFERRTGASPEVSRSATVIRKAAEAESDISDVLKIVSSDVDTVRSLRKERRSAMFIYKIIIILTFGVSLITAYFIVTSFLSIQPVGGAEVPGFTTGGIDIGLVKELFFHALLLQALFVGALASQMGEDDPRAGLKYSVALLLLTYVVFARWVLPALPQPIQAEEMAMAAAFF